MSRFVVALAVGIAGSAWALVRAVGSGTPKPPTSLPTPIQVTPPPQAKTKWVPIPVPANTQIDGYAKPTAADVAKLAVGDSLFVMLGVPGGDPKAILVALAVVESTTGDTYSLAPAKPSIVVRLVSIVTKTPPAAALADPDTDQNSGGGRGAFFNLSSNEVAAIEPQSKTVVVV